MRHHERAEQERPLPVWVGGEVQEVLSPQGRGGTRRAATAGPCWLLRCEVEALVEKKHGLGYLENQRAKAELALVNRELKRLKTEVAALEARRTELLAEIEH